MRLLNDSYVTIQSGNKVFAATKSPLLESWTLLRNRRGSHESGNSSFSKSLDIQFSLKSGNPFIICIVFKILYLSPDARLTVSSIMGNPPLNVAEIKTNNGCVQ